MVWVCSGYNGYETGQNISQVKHEDFCNLQKKTEHCLLVDIEMMNFLKEHFFLCWGSLNALRRTSGN